MFVGRARHCKQRSGVWLSCVFLLGNFSLGIKSGPDIPDPSFTSVAAGQAHTCGLTSTGEIYCWGSNDAGQLGVGGIDSNPHSNPAIVKSSVKFRFVTAGFRHTCGIGQDGAAYCWGWNQFGQLGNGARTSSPQPILVSGGLRFVSLSAGATLTCGLTASGEAYCWGGNWHGQIGDGTVDGDTGTPCCHTRPVPVAGHLRFSQISVGGIHACALGQGGKAYCWGNGEDGRLGLGRPDSNDQPQPEPVAGEVKFRLISVRGWHSCGIADGGRAYCWGRGLEGQLGMGRNIERVNTPAEVLLRDRFASISVGSVHSCGLTQDKALYCWGDNKLGQVGTGSGHVLAPMRQFSNLRFREIAAGGNEFSGHTCGITLSSKLMCWGDNRKGQLGTFSAPTGFDGVRKQQPKRF